MNSKFTSWVTSISKKYKQSQIKAAYKVNSELINFYLELGKEINSTSFKKEYGSNFFIKLSGELKKELPNSSGFSPRNLAYIESFYILYRKILQQLVAKFETDIAQTKKDDLICEYLLNKISTIPWGHITILINRFNNEPMIVLYYIHKIAENNWSRAMLENYISLQVHKREGQSINNFSITLSNAPSTSITQLSKDPFYFEFAELRDDYDEKELKNSLVDHIKDFLLELGTGFAFVGQEYRIRVGESDFYIDLLFYNITLHAYVVLEIKTTKFKPEYLGQLNFYVSAIDREIKIDNDNKTIGLLICKEKDGVVAKYSLDNLDAPLGISSYEISNILAVKSKDLLPTIEELENRIKDKFGY